ncbi:MAG: hypothetical protein K6A76_08510 [Oribacterium sp.]|nr:hypothetical protein [Oribacterium sp.]
MRFNDVQDTRRSEIKKEQREATAFEFYQIFANKLSCINRSHKNSVAVFGATFTI